MRKLKIFATTTLVAASIGVGSLAAAPSASAMPMTCSQALALAHNYIEIGKVFLNLGQPANAAYYFGKADGIMDAAC
jgi:hypothetical protein